MDLPGNIKIEQISCAPLAYARPRAAGKNARLGVHGPGGDTHIARVRIGGQYGFGWCALKKEQCETFIGLPAPELFGEDGLVIEKCYGLEFPLLDWLGNFKCLPVYKLLAGKPIVHGSQAIGAERAYSAPAYDTSIYIDEPDGASDLEAVELLCSEVEQGLARGHTNFKVKVGRCGRWMGLEPGIKRDIAIINAIRGRIGPGGSLMADANNGYNLNLAKRFLYETCGSNLLWLEEAFHEDDILYQALKEWMAAEGINTLIADGEGYASPRIIEWASEGLIDVIQFDLRYYGFHRWLSLAKQLDAAGVRSAPHNYGGYYGNYASAHIAGAIDNFAFVEWDEASVREIDASAYSISNGRVHVPDLPGFGLKLDGGAFDRAVNEKGWSVG